MAFFSERPFVKPNSITLSYFFKELIVAGNFLIYIFVYMSVCLPPKNVHSTRVRHLSALFQDRGIVMNNA